MSNNVIAFPGTKRLQPNLVDKVHPLIRSLACGLMFNLRINPSASLVCLLGNGNEQSNQGAIETWLTSEIGLDKIITMRSPLNELTKILFTHLNNQLNTIEEI